MIVSRIERAAIGLGSHGNCKEAVKTCSRCPQATSNRISPYHNVRNAAHLQQVESVGCVANPTMSEDVSRGCELDRIVLIALLRRHAEVLPHSIFSRLLQKCMQINSVMA